MPHGFEDDGQKCGKRKAVSVTGDGDGDLDLVVQFTTADLGLSEADTEAVLEGQILDGTLIQGSDSINVVP